MGRVRSLVVAAVVLTVGWWGSPGVSSPVVASALAGPWMGARGPSGGSVGEVEIGPDGTIYAGTGGAGVFVSRDGGLSWRRGGTGLPADVGVSGIAVSMSSASRVYLSTWQHGAYRSDDGGASWRRIHPAATVSDVAVDPTNPDTVYLGDAGGYSYKSTDGGATWAEMTLPGQSFFMSDVLEVAPSNPNVIYATEGPSLLRSDDAGATWHGTNGYTTNVVDITVHPTDPDTVYVATSFDQVQGSTDGGRTWTTGTGLPDLPAYSVEIDRSRPTTVYAGTARAGYAYRSVDAGATWQPYRVGIATGAVGHLVSGPAGVVYAGTDYHGVFRSTDHGATWALRTTGLVGSDVRALVAVPASPSTVYAGTYGDGVHRSTDGGQSWHRRGLTGRFVYDLAMHKSSSLTVYAATDRGVYKTTDGGSSWRRITTGVVGVNSIAVAPSNPAVVYAVSWTGVIKSVDAGRTWKTLSVPSPAGSLARYQGLAVHPTSSARVWVGSLVQARTVMRTTDGGLTWRSALACPEHYGPTDLTVDPRQPWIVYAGCDYAGVYQSLDRGVTWRWISRGVTGTVTEVVVDPADSRRLYAGTYTGSYVSGVYRSIDRGATWTLFSTGMTTTWTHALTITSTSSALYAGTTGYGVGGSGGGVFTYRLK
jgi:photosystem II stability/assembly factor-like uncharacterized protein